MLSFSSAFKGLAKRLGDDLGRANIDVVFDQWEGGGGVPAFQAVPSDLADVAGLMVLLTPSDGAPTWISEEWHAAVYSECCARGVPILPVRGEFCAIPDFLADRSFADLCNRGYGMELNRLVATVREVTGDDRIVPLDEEVAARDRSPEAMGIEPIALELGAELARVFEAACRDHFVTEMVPMMRDGLFYELGVPMPDLAIRTAPDLPAAAARVLINGVPETLVELHLGWVMVNDDAVAMRARGFDAKPVANPANNAPCAWIPAADRDTAERGGLTIWDEEAFLALTISALLRRKAADFVDVHATRVMLRKLALAFPNLVAEAVPAVVSEFLLSDVLRRLVAEQASVRNLRRIVMALAERAPIESDPLYLTEYVRAALKREITYRLTHGTGTLIVFLLDPDIEATLRAATVHTPTGSYVDLPPERLRPILEAIRAAVMALGEGVQLPAILTAMEIRAAVRRLVAPWLPLLQVASYHDLRPEVNIQPIDRISLDGPRHRRPFTVESPWTADRNAEPRRARPEAREHPDVRPALEAIEALLTPQPAGGYELLPVHEEQVAQILQTFLERPELAALVQGLIDLADRLGAQGQSEDAAQAILRLVERPVVLEPLEALVEAARHYASHNTTISPEVDAQLRADAYRAQINFGTPGEYRSSEAAFRSESDPDRGSRG